MRATVGRLGLKSLDWPDFVNFWNYSNFERSTCQAQSSNGKVVLVLNCM